MFVSQAHSFTQQARLAITLAWVAGYTNILTILTCGRATSHVTGTLTELGRELSAGAWELVGLTILILFMFFGGAMLSGFCTETGRRRGWESIYVLPVAVQAVLLAAFAVAVELHDGLGVGWHGATTDGWRGWGAGWRGGAVAAAVVGVASMAMGLQNATITRISGGVVRTTHMTGVFTDLGSEAAQFFYWVLDRRRDVPPSRLSPMALMRSARAHPTTRRLALLASVIGSFVLGAGLGTAAFGIFPRLAMFPPVLFLLWIIVQDVRAPICEIEASDLLRGGADGGGEGASGDGGELTAGSKRIAVFHLRKERGRGNRRHRMPDLLRWCERLPREKRVVILDLADAAELDANAALELRALLLQATRNGRRMVISGMNREQYQAMVRAGAGDVLDPTNVCPDLELAIARGLMLLDGMAE
jgi:uncharacterized membrane protein YoaK (UPF0700 family)